MSASRRRNDRRTRPAATPPGNSDPWKSEGEFGYAARAHRGPGRGRGRTGPHRAARAGLHRRRLRDRTPGSGRADPARPPCLPGKFASFTGWSRTPLALRRGPRWGDSLIDSLLIPNVEPTPARARRPPQGVPELDAVGIIETLSVASTVCAGDIAAKTACRAPRPAAGRRPRRQVLRDLTGEVADVTCGRGSRRRRRRARGLLVRRVVILCPHGTRAECWAREEPHHRRDLLWRRRPPHRADGTPSSRPLREPRGASGHRDRGAGRRGRTGMPSRPPSRPRARVAAARRARAGAGLQVVAGGGHAATLDGLPDGLYPYAVSRPRQLLPATGPGLMLRAAGGG